MTLKLENVPTRIVLLLNRTFPVRLDFKTEQVEAQFGPKWFYSWKKRDAVSIPIGGTISLLNKIKCSLQFPIYIYIYIHDIEPFNP